MDEILIMKDKIKYKWAKRRYKERITRTGESDGRDTE
jgi:hypothetical protein